MYDTAGSAKIIAEQQLKGEYVYVFIHIVPSWPVWAVCSSNI